MSGAEIFRMERAKGSSIGATIVAFFGAVWLAIGIAGVGISWPIGLAAVLPVFVVVALLGAAVRRRLPKISVETPEKKQMMQAFGVVNIVQWVAIFGAVNLLDNLHLSGWIVPAIVLIVGAHFIPLARIFHSQQHLQTGIAMMVCAAIAVVLPASIRDVVECVSAGVILWISAGVALRCAFRMASAGVVASQTGLH